jgi:hypothetical protein
LQTISHGKAGDSQRPITSRWRRPTWFIHVVQNHPFLDGNKRTGAAAAIIFLHMNDIEVEGDEDGLVDLT